MEQNNSSALLLTSAKGIQSWIMATNKLKEMIGGSVIVARLPQDILDEVIKQVINSEQEDMKEYYTPVVQAAGGAILQFKNIVHANAVAAIWPLVAARFAPGLEVVQAVIVCTDENPGQKVIEGERILAQIRNIHNVELPEAGPIVTRNGSTSLPGIVRVSISGKKEILDASLSRKRNEEKGGRKQLLKKLIPEGFPEKIYDRFPRDFEGLVTKDNPYIAIIHIDLNGLGDLRRKVLENSEKNLEQLTAFSKTINIVIEEAMRATFGAVIHTVDANAKDKKTYALQPIVCSGDDITLVTGAPYALGFVDTFISNFEDIISKSDLEKLGIKGGTTLSACAGVAFVKKNFPFSLAYQLSASLCDYAKAKTGRQRSAVAFHRVSESSTTTYDRIVNETLTVEKRHLTMNPYLLGKEKPGKPLLPHLKQLTRLCQVLDKSPSMQEIVNSMYNTRERVEQKYERMCDIHKKKSPDSIEQFKDALKELTGSEEHPLWASRTGLPDLIPARTPILDAVELLTMKTIFEFKSKIQEEK